MELGMVPEKAFSEKGSPDQLISREILTKSRKYLQFIQNLCQYLVDHPVYFYILKHGSKMNFCTKDIDSYFTGLHIKRQYTSLGTSSHNAYTMCTA